MLVEQHVHGEIHNEGKEVTKGVGKVVQELQNVGADVGYHVGDGIDCSMTTFENVPFLSNF